MKIRRLMKIIHVALVTVCLKVVCFIFFSGFTFHCTENCKGRDIAQYLSGDGFVGNRLVHVTELAQHN